MIFSMHQDLRRTRVNHRQSHMRPRHTIVGLISVTLYFATSINAIMMGKNVVDSQMNSHTRVEKYMH